MTPVAQDKVVDRLVRRGRARHSGPSREQGREGDGKSARGAIWKHARPFFPARRHRREIVPVRERTQCHFIVGSRPKGGSIRCERHYNSSMTRTLDIAIWFLFAAMMYLITAEAFGPWLTLPGLGNVGFTLVFRAVCGPALLPVRGRPANWALFRIGGDHFLSVRGDRRKERGHLRTLSLQRHARTQTGARADLIPLAWFMMIYPSWRVAGALPLYRAYGLSCGDRCPGVDRLNGHDGLGHGDGPRNGGRRQLGLGERRFLLREFHCAITAAGC